MSDPVLPHKRLEVRSELHAIGRVEVDHLYLTAHAFVLKQGVHNLQRVTQDEAIGPRSLVLVGVELVGDVEVGVAEQVEVGAERLV